MSSVTLPIARGQPLWRTAQVAGVLLTLVLVAGLVVAPRLSLHLLWDMVIPVLPAVFLVNPLIWRNVCPLATLNDFSGSAPGRSAMPPAVMRGGWVIGVTLLFLLVPARRFLFNEDGVALAATIVAVAALALAGGLVFARRAGFCGSVCPVLPVEKLYGQSPLARVRGARCTSCSVCTPVGCIDLAGDKTIAQTVGPHRRDSGWILTTFGAFAASFPGFILGYFTVENGAFSTAPTVYMHILGYSMASYAIVGLFVVAFNLRSARVIRILGAAALVTYYWFALPRLVEAYREFPIVS